MIDLKHTEGIYFVGIGGIGMSALALYFSEKGFRVAGYDRSMSFITASLVEKGCQVTDDDCPSSIPVFFRDVTNAGRIKIVYTPAIHSENNILTWFRSNGFDVSKRSEVLGAITHDSDTIAVAGTHGKTTVTTMISHLLKQSAVGCSAFLGGISKNYNTNYIGGEGKFTVVEADEFDRSFHRLNPLVAVVTSLDADHLDIYGDHGSMIEAYNEFCDRIRSGGCLIVNNPVRQLLRVPEGVKCLTYGAEQGSDYLLYDVQHRQGYYSFSVKTPQMKIEDIHFRFPGIINLVNMTAAVSVALECGVTTDEIRSSVPLFQGVRRRFDIRFDSAGLTYIDDYAHHPEEIWAFVTSVREYFPGRRITGIFQPHLYSRTRDHFRGFASILDNLDETILLPVYPAREKPIPGVTSQLIFDEMRSENKRILSMDEIMPELDMSAVDVLVTIGAGDIDRLVQPIEDKMKMYSGR